MDPSFHPQLLDPQSAVAQAVHPANGRCFELDELYKMLDCEMVEVIDLSDELILIADENSKFRNPPYLNLLATAMWHQAVPAARGVDFIAGRVLLCHTTQFE